MPIVSNFPNGGSSGGISLAAVSNIKTLVASGKVYVKWTDPDDVVVSKVSLATWDGTLLVRKAGSMPTNRRDGTVVIDSTTRNQYKDTYFCDSGLTDGETYYYKFFPYTTNGIYSDDAENEFSAMPTAQVAGINGWAVTNMSASTEAGNGKMTVKWTDPAATITSDGVTLATWASTTIVVKAGSYATSKDDANAAYVFKSTTRNQYSNNPLTVTGLTNGTTYYISFFPETTDGGINTSTSQRTTGVANRITIGAVPSQSGSLTYNGNSQTPSWSNYNAAQMTLGGSTSGTNAGDYTASFTPTADYRWSDGTTAAKNVTWSIAKAAGSLSLSKTSIDLNSSTKSATFTVTRAGDGKITVESSNTGVATATLSGTTVTVKSVNNATGTATITVKVAAGTNHTAPSNKTCSVNAKFIDATFANNDWATIINACQTNTVPSTWKVGDRKQITINGNQYTYSLVIIGKNHDKYSDDGETAPLTFQLNYYWLWSGQVVMSPNGSIGNNYGWEGCNVRVNLLPTILSMLPEEVQDAIREVDKVTSSGGVNTSTLKTTSDKLFLLSEVEVFGQTTYSMAGEGSQYAYYAAGNDPLMGQTYESIFTRSPEYRGYNWVAIDRSSKQPSCVPVSGTSYYSIPAFCF